MKKFTKIVATISDRRCDVEFIRALYENGMNVVRMNSAHIQLEGYAPLQMPMTKISNFSPVTR